MPSRFDTFSKLLAGPASPATGFRLPGVALVSSAIRAFNTREATPVSPYADACRGYEGIDYINCLHDAEVQARGGEPGVLHVDARSSAHFNAVRFNASDSVRFNATSVQFNGMSAVRFNAATSVRFNAVKSVRFNAVTARFNAGSPARFNAVTSARFNAVSSVRFNAVTPDRGRPAIAGTRR